MRGNEKVVSRRGFVAGASAAAATLALGGSSLVGCSSGKDSNSAGKAKKVEEKWVPTTCNMCFNNCSILAHVVDGIVVDIKGDDRSPIGWGHICAKGAAGIMQLYDENRIMKPLKRTNPKKGIGVDPEWEEITWDEAYSLAAGALKEAGEKKALVNYFSLITDISLSYAIRPLVAASGATLLNLGADICGAGIHSAYDAYVATGNGQPDYQYCKYILQFGTQAGTHTRHGTNTNAKLLAKSRVEGTRLVNFDPHMGGSAEKADLWVPIRPGSDAAAALSIANVLVNELGTIDTDFLTKRTNGPALVDVETGRVLRKEGTSKPIGKALYMDSDGTPKPYDEAKQPLLEGTFTVDGKTVSTGFTLYKEHLKTYTPEYQEPITTVPAATIRQVAKELGEAACFGQTMEVDGVTLPYRPVCVDAFSGISRHKHAFLTQWSVFSLNALLGSPQAVGGFIGFGSTCKGFEETGYVQYAPKIWEPDGLMEAVGISGAPLPNTSIYKNIYERDFTPKSPSMMQMQPFSIDNHFGFIAQVHPDIYHTKPAEYAISSGSTPLTNWGNHDEMAGLLQTYKYIIGINIYLDDSAAFYDVVIPEASYLERWDPLPHMYLNHRTPGGMNIPWTLCMRQPVVPSIGDTPSSIEIGAQIADRLGVTDKLVAALNKSYSVNEKYSVPTDKKINVVDYVNSVYKSHLGEKYTNEWFLENGVHTYPRKVDEVYIWAGDKPGRVPIYWDFLLEAKDKADAKASELGFPWETDDFQPLPDWKPGPDFEMTDPEFDLFPVYYTNSVNTDSWQMENAWLNEINEANPYGYTIEMNSATAAAKGLVSGDHVVLTGKNGASIKGRIAVSETVHLECISVLGGHWNLQSEKLPIAKGKGLAINELIPGLDPSRFDHLCAAFDQCVRVKIEKA
ncbi:MAG: molybdopterin-dependent oxidoreductase [Raoultibacter sp.]